MNRVADTVAAVLAAHGVRHAFGMPGGEVVTLIDALERAGIAFHLARHETAAALMAAGVSTVVSAPGVLVTTLGPGLANAVNGIADAAQERVPLIVLSGVVERDVRGRYTHQVIDHAALLRPLVKASFEVDAGGAGQTVARALALALSAPMGPVHLDLSPATAAATDPKPWTAGPAERHVPRFRKEDAEIQALAGRLMKAGRPLILAGYEAARADIGPHLLRLAEKIGAPVLTTYKAKGLVPEDHPLSLGAAGLSPAADRILLDLVGKAGTVLMIGYDPIEMRLGWLDPAPRDRIVEITEAPADHAMHSAATCLVGDVGSVLTALCAAVEVGTGWPDGAPATARAALAERFATPAPWGPHAIVDALNEAAGDDALVTVDSGAHRILLSQKWRARRPLSLLQSAGFCTMAAALPLAIGAKLAEPDRRVIAVVGDGGIEMGIGELATLRDLALPLTIVVFQDRSLALIALKQAAAGLRPAGVALGETDFAAVAAGFGGHGRTVEDLSDLRAELAEAGKRDGFTLIACRFDADAYQDAF